jgi:hypothetical protein|nr:hypothetical protein [Kofleriaceae bacterium]
MRRLALATLLALCGAAAADPPAAVVPFLRGDEDGVLAVTGAFGPAKDTTIVVTYDMHGAGSYRGFALVPDAGAPHGYGKVPLPALPSGAELGSSKDGAMRAALTANIDGRRGDELVLELATVCCAGAQGAWMGVTYVVLAWRGGVFVRASDLESKLETALVAKDGSHATPLTDAELRAALKLK